MRVAHVTATYPPYKGGTGNVAHGNAVELARRGHEVTVITGADGAPSEVRQDGLLVRRLPVAFRVGNAPALRGLGRALAGHDLVHLHYPFYFGAESAWWHCRRAGLPYVVTYHHDVLFEGPMAAAAAIHHRLVANRILADARLVAATSADYAASSRLASLRASTGVIPNGVDASRFQPGLDAGDLRARLEVAGDSPVVLFVGGLDRPHFFKGLPVLLEAMRELPDATLVVVGDGELRSDFERQAGANGQPVRFAGKVDDAELPRFYALADVVVLPSITRGEAFGLVLLEGMASGKPVVASDLPGVRTVVQEGTNGFLARAGDAAHLAAQLRRLLADPALRQRFGAAGRELVLRWYDWHRIGDRLEQIYAYALSSNTTLPRELAA